MFRKLAPLTLGVWIVLAACGGDGRIHDAAVADASLAFWEARLARHPDDLLTPSEIAARYLARFAARRDVDDLGRAERTLAQGLEHHPRHAAFLQGMAAVHIARHEFPEALAKARTAYRLEPRRSANGPLFDAFFETGQYDSARVALERMDPDGFAYLIRRARYAAAVGQPATATRALSRACRTEGLTLPSVRAWCSARRIDLAMLTATPSEARRLLGRALRRTPDDPAFQAALAEAAYADGSLDEARRAYERLAAAGGEEAHLWLARIAVRQHDPLAADSHRVRFEAIARDPRWGRAWWSPLAEMLAESGRVDEALALARRDVRQRPGPEAWHTMANILWRAGRTAEAREAVLRAQGWTPRDRALAALRDSIDRVSP